MIGLTSTQAYCVLIFSLMTALFSPGRAQINNPSFEEWELVDSIYKPVGWSTFSTLGYNAYDYINPDTISIQGDSSLQLQFTPRFPGMCDTRIWHDEYVTVSGIGELISLFCWIKSIPHPGLEEENYVRVRGAVFQDGLQVGSYEWSSQEFFPAFTEIEIPIPFSSPDSISIEFTAGANPIPISNVDGCRDFNITWIDDLRLGTTLINDASEAGSSLTKEVNIAPNPSNGIFEIRQEDLHYNYAEIFDAQGRKVATLYLASTTERLRLEKRGLYFVRFFNGREEVPSLLKRVVVD